jgi:hypothetical protein
MDRNQNLISTTKDIAPESGTFFNTLRNNTERKLNKIAVTTLVSLGVLGLTACSGGREPAFEDPAAAETSEPSEPAMTEVETPTPEVTAPSEFESSMVGETYVQTKTLEEIKAMPLIEYANLPAGERVAYIINYVGNESFPTFDSDQEEEEFFEISGRNLPNYMSDYAVGISFNDGDPDARAKMSGGYRYYTTTKGTGNISESYQSVVDDAIAKGGEGIGANANTEVSNYGDIQHGLDRDGNPIDFINYTYVDTSQAPEDQTVRTMQFIRVKVQLLDGTTSIYWADGYAIDGEMSPDDRYPY